LEVREEVGLGHTANAILLDGVLRAGQPIVVAKRAGAVVTRVRAIFMPKPLDEMRDPRDRFTPVGVVQAAAGVKVAAPDLEGVLAGSPFLGLEEGQDVEEARRQVEQEVSAIFIETDREGVVVKADTLGSLEALVQVLHRRGVAVRLADIGPVSKRDVVEAAAVRERDPYQGVILAFGVRVSPDAEREAAEREVPIFTDPLIYNLVDGYLKWVQREREAEEKKLFERLTPPCKFQILRGYIFRRSDPAIFGVEVLLGRLRQKVRVITEAGREVGAIHQIQDKGKAIEEADVGAQVAVSMKEPIVGRHIDEGMVLYTFPRRDELELLKDRFRDRLREDEAQALEELVAARRKVDPLYGF
jgi:translation initiation factor 5B